MSKYIVNYGSINIDHVYRVPHFVRPGETLASDALTTGLGGKGANQSVAIAQAGGQVVHVGQLSSSDEWALRVMQSLGVNTEFVKQVDGASGHAIIQVDQNAENAILLHGGANQSCQRKDLATALDSVAEAEYLLMQNECNDLCGAIDLACERGLKVALNPAPMSDSVKALPLHKLDTLIVNQVEACELSDETELDAIIEHLQVLAPDARIIITLGAGGAVLISNKLRHTAKARKVEAIDTTGAGDTFVGYFLSLLLEGLEESKALQTACDAAALAVTKHGAISAIPSRSDLTGSLTTNNQ